MSEIIFEKAQKNLRLVYDRLNGSNVGRFTHSQEVLFLAIGGYNRTYDLLISMGVARSEIATFSSLSLTTDFIRETHQKKVVYIKKINYVTSVNRMTSFSKKNLDLKVAEGFQESMLVYQDANRRIKSGKDDMEWIKPRIVILDDQSVNLQFEGYRFYYQQNFGFCQMRNRNADPWKIIHEIKQVEATDQLKFVMYQDQNTDETAVLDGLERLRMNSKRHMDDLHYFKPTEFKKILGSNELVVVLKELPELGITQFLSNKKIGKENARWIVIPDMAFQFKGFHYLDEEDLFNQELLEEENQEQMESMRQEKLLQSILTLEFPLNFKIGYLGDKLLHSPIETLQTFLGDIDGVESEQVKGLSLLEGASTEAEYKEIKKRYLAYFLDGQYQDDIRKDDHYLGGRRLLSIDVDDGDYTRQDLEHRLEQQNLFGLIYPTAKHYFDGSLRWRLILMADEEMSKESYRRTISGVAEMLNLEIDESSKKVSQLMGYPLKREDVSTVIGTMVNVAQFRTPDVTVEKNVVPFSRKWGGKTRLLDANHKQARLLKDALEHGVQEGYRNETYYQIVRYLKDTLKKAEFSHWHEEAEMLLEQVKAQMIVDGLSEGEVALICR